MKTTGTFEAGKDLWNYPNTGATNESGFSGLPSGFRYQYGWFNYIEYYGYWWSSKENSTTDALKLYLVSTNNNTNLGPYYKECGLKVRYVRDN